MPIPDLILRLEESCRDVSQSIRYVFWLLELNSQTSSTLSFSFLFNAVSVMYRYGSDIRHRVVEDKLMRQKAQLLLGEAASWSLLWNLYGKG